MNDIALCCDKLSSDDSDTDFWNIEDKIIDAYKKWQNICFAVEE